MPEDVIDKLAALYWDTDVEPERLKQLHEGKIDRIRHIDRMNLFRRVLSSYDWYTILALVPRDRLGEALSPAVIERLYPPSLRERYLYVRKVLFG